MRRQGIVWGLAALVLTASVMAAAACGGDGETRAAGGNQTPTPARGTPTVTPTGTPTGETENTPEGLPPLSGETVTTDSGLQSGETPAAGGDETPTKGGGQAPATGAGQTPAAGAGQTPAAGGQTPTGGGGGTTGGLPPPPEGTVTTDSHVTIVNIVKGTGETPQTGQTLVIHYTAWLTNGTKIDSSRDRGTPFEFVLGDGQVIAGLEEGLATMQVGGRRFLTIPPELAWGEQGSPPTIPPNATLIFDVELLEIR